MLDKKSFLNPEATWRGKPFWSWNGTLEIEELKRQMDIFQTMGMGGFFCHSRTGLETEYLGEHWFDLINQCADYAYDKGMETWVYDEDRWPSGTAGGLVTKEPRFRQKNIRARIISVEEYTKDLLQGEYIAAYSAQMDGVHYEFVQPLQPEDSPCGNVVLLFTIEEMAKNSFYNGYTYLDAINKDATQAFLDITHEQYLAHSDGRLGTKIAGFFTDESHRGSLMAEFNLANELPEYLTPYTYDLFEEFEKRFGYKLQERLPELFFFPTGVEFSQVKYQYVELLMQLFNERYLQPLQDWCHKNNAKLTGHMLHEDSLSAQVCMTGSLMRTYEFMDIPGVDLLGRYNHGYWIVKQLQSVARQLGKKHLLSEMYGCTGWDLSFDEHKRLCDWQMLFGINLRCQHLSWYTMKGEAKRDYPASVSYQSYWHKYYRYVEDYFARIGCFRAQGESQCDVLVLNPVESLWGNFHPGWVGLYFQILHEQGKKLQAQYESVLHTLCDAQVDFDYGDEEQLGRLGSIKDGRLQVGKASYGVVVVAGLKTIRSTTLSLLKAFRQAGGRVVIVDELPTYVDALPSSTAVNEVLDGCACCDVAHLVQTMGVKPSLSITDANGNAITGVYLQTNAENDCVHYMLLDVQRTTDRTIYIGPRPYDYLECWDPRTGEVTLLCDDRSKTVKWELPVGGELLLTARATNNGYETVEQTEYRRLTNTTLPDTFAYRLTEPNVCLLNRAAFAVGDEPLSEPTEILKIDDILHERFDVLPRGGEMIQPWFRKRFGMEEEHNDVPLTMHFSFTAEYLPAHVRLAVETPEQFTIALNGREDALTRLPQEQWVDPCFAIFELDRAVLCEGNNTITLKTSFNGASNLENIFLLGEFGVRVEGTSVCLTTMPERLAVGDISTQGFPFYGAGMVYKIPCPQGEGSLKLKLDGKGAACYAVRGSKDAVVAFPPYEVDMTADRGNEIEVEYVFTRFNTFGPLHQKPTTLEGCNPTSFRTKGEKYIGDRYLIISQGMLTTPDFYGTM